MNSVLPFLFWLTFLPTGEEAFVTETLQECDTESVSLENHPGGLVRIRGILRSPRGASFTLDLESGISIAATGMGWLPERERIYVVGWFEGVITTNTEESEASDGRDLFLYTFDCEGRNQKLTIFRKGGDQMSFDQTLDGENILVAGSFAEEGGDTDGAIYNIFPSEEDPDAFMVFTTDNDEDEQFSKIAIKRGSSSEPRRVFVTSDRDDPTGGQDVDVYEVDPDTWSPIASTRIEGAGFNRATAIIPKIFGVEVIVAAQSEMTIDGEPVMKGEFGDGSNDGIVINLGDELRHVRSRYLPLDEAQFPVGGVDGPFDVTTLWESRPDAEGNVLVFYDETFNEWIEIEIPDMNIRDVDLHRGRFTVTGMAGEDALTTADAFQTEPDGFFSAYMGSGVLPFTYEIVLNIGGDSVRVEIPLIDWAENLPPGGASKLFALPVTQDVEVVAGTDTMTSKADTMNAGQMTVRILNNGASTKLEIPMDKHSPDMGGCKDELVVANASMETIELRGLDPIERLDPLHAEGQAGLLVRPIPIAKDLVFEYNLGTAQDPEVIQVSPGTLEGIGVRDQEALCAWGLLLFTGEDAGGKTLQTVSVQTFDFNGNRLETKVVTSTEGDEELPTKHALHGNYPNPFNPSTTLEYRIGAPGQVTLTVYDVNGRSVATLVRSTHRPGNYSVTWDGRDVSNRLVASGTYFARLVVDDFVGSTTLQLLK